jgi:hypothetical protein
VIDHDVRHCEPRSGETISVNNQQEIASQTALAMTGSNRVYFFAFITLTDSVMSSFNTFLSTSLRRLM